jgi:hypothetical protein
VLLVLLLVLLLISVLPVSIVGGVLVVSVAAVQ